MKQKEKNLLLKDLCSRLTYGVKVKFGDSKPALLTVIEHDEFGWQIGSEDEFGGMITIIDNVKPYLFPLASMTEEQKNSFPFSYSFLEALIDGSVYFDEDECITLNDMIDIIQWCYKNHFDIYGLIPMGLAIDATGLNIY